MTNTKLDVSLEELSVFVIHYSRSPERKAFSCYIDGDTPFGVRHCLRYTTQPDLVIVS